MSLSRPVKFPLLKLPWLCIRCVVQNSHPVGLIYFATISDRTRRIVKSSNYPVQEVDVSLNRSSICMGKGKYWYFTHNKNEFGVPLILRRNSEPFLTGASFVPNIGSYLHSYTDGDTLDALKIGIEFMIDVFGCTVGQVLAGDKLSELLRLGISSVKELYIGNSEPVNITDLKYVLENIKVTDKYVFYVPIPANFSCNPQIFKCRRMSFLYNGSADWVTLELLCQFDVPQLSFSYHWFTKQDIVSYVTYWFNSENRELEYLHIHFNNLISLEDFEIDHLYPMPFCKKRRSRWSFVGRWKDTDMSSGKDILRKDGLLATFFVKPTSVFSTEILFYIWHKRFPDAV
ncbi:unnamed protein product [Caenorhabditis brenneri]